MIKVSDYIFDFLSKKGVDTAFCVTGGAAAHLLESLRNSRFRVINNYNEQACAMAAEAYARITGKPALVLVTNGPGSTNLITGVLGAWQDSIPMFILSGQVPTHNLLRSESVKLRQLGVQESDIISMVKHCTNYCSQVTEAYSIRTELECAWNYATTNRMGPVWLDIPINIQSEKVNPENLMGFFSVNAKHKNDYSKLLYQIKLSKKPLIIAGNGIHLAKAEEKFKKFISDANIPVVATWNAKDIFNSQDELYIGNFGLLGERAANLAVQNCDLLIVIGSRLSVPLTGYDATKFAPNAKKAMIDIDSNEIEKSTLNIDFAYVADINDFLNQMNLVRAKNKWNDVLVSLKKQYTVFDENHTRKEGYINSFDFMKFLSSKLKKDDVVVTDMGTSFTCTMQSLQHTGNDRLFTSSGLSSMGFGLPGAIGAFLGNQNSRVICIAGDGGMQMNIQELQTVAYHRLPIKIIVLNNKGYLAISLMQDNLFNGIHFGSDPSSGVDSPDFVRVAQAYNIPAIKFNTIEEVESGIDEYLNSDEPVLIELNMVRNQLLIPRVQSKKDETGKIVSGTLDTMFPFLNEEQTQEIKVKIASCEN